MTEKKPFDVMVAHVTRVRVYAESKDAAAEHVVKGGPAGVVSEALTPQVLDVLEIEE